MEYKDFCEEAEIEYKLTVTVNGVTVMLQETSMPDRIEEALGTIERHNFIGNELQRQFESLPEPDYYTEEDYCKAEEIRDAMREDGTL